MIIENPASFTAKRTSNLRKSKYDFDPILEGKTIFIPNAPKSFNVTAYSWAKRRGIAVSVKRGEYAQADGSKLTGAMVAKVQAESF